MALPGSNIASRQRLIFATQDIIDCKRTFEDDFYKNISAIDYNIIHNLVYYRFDKLGWGDYGKDFVKPKKKIPFDRWGDGFTPPPDNEYSKSRRDWLL